MTEGYVYIDNDQERARTTLARCVRIRNQAIKVVDKMVFEARANGLSWQEIAECLGVSRQAAQGKYGKK